MYRVAHRLLNDPDDAEDVRQRVFARLLADPSRLDGVGSPGAWLAAAAANAAKNHMRTDSRRRRRHRRRRADPSFTRPAPDPAAPAERADEAARLRAALARLPEEQRAILVLRFDAGLTLAEVAEHLAIPLGTAKDRARRAADALRRLLTPPEPPS